MALKKRFNFTKKNRKGKIEKTGYLDITENEEQGRCSLYFYGDIVSATWQSMWYEEDKCPQDIADFLNQLDGYEEIDIYFNSGGGDVFAGLAIYNQLKRYSGRKIGYVDAMAASIASVIMFACDELHFATGAQAMIHKPLQALERMYQQKNITVAAASEHEIERLRADSDTVEGFIMEECENVDGYREERTELYKRYSVFCEENERQPLTKNNFYKSLRLKGYQEITSIGKRYFLGLKIALENCTNDGFIQVTQEQLKDLPFD